MHFPITSLLYKPFINFGSQTSSLITWASEEKIFISKVCKFLSLIEILGQLTNFSVTNLYSIYDYILDKWVNRGNFSDFSIVRCLFLLHLMEIFPITHSFWKKILLNTA